MNKIFPLSKKYFSNVPKEIEDLDLWKINIFLWLKVVDFWVAKLYFVATIFECFVCLRNVKAVLRGRWDIINMASLTWGRIEKLEEAHVLITCLGSADHVKLLTRRHLQTQQCNSLSQPITVWSNFLSSPRLRLRHQLRRKEFSAKFLNTTRAFKYHVWLDA